MNGWYFVLGLFVGSAWTLGVTRVHFSNIKDAWSRLARPKYATIKIGDNTGSVTLTDDPTDPRLGRGVGGKGMNEAYLVLSDEERAKGFVRPVRRSYVHRFMLDGSPLPKVLVSLDGVGGCGALTTMAQALAETYAREPSFYGATYCVGCGTHLPVGADGEFYWDGTDEKVGT